MNIKYDSSLVNYNSESFIIGHKEGSISENGEPTQNRPDDMSDVDWASYCEGVLIGWCEKLGD